MSHKVRPRTSQLDTLHLSPSETCLKLPPPPPHPKQGSDQTYCAASIEHKVHSHNSNNIVACAVLFVCASLAVCVSWIYDSFQLAKKVSVHLLISKWAFLPPCLSHYASLAEVRINRHQHTPVYIVCVFVCVCVCVRVYSWKKSVVSALQYFENRSAQGLCQAE